VQSLIYVHFLAASINVADLQTGFVKDFRLQFTPDEATPK
jgi:hypothetical protein